MSQELKSWGQLGQLATTKIQGRDVPTAQAILNRCHREATDRGYVLAGCESKMECAPSPQNNQLAIVHVRLHFRMLTDTDSTGPVYTYEALGDADAATGGRVNGRYVALAETRAISRAASMALNVDQEMLENGAAAPSAPVTYVPPAATGAPTLQVVPDGTWTGPIPLGHNKGKMLNDPTVSINDLQWMANNLKLIDKVTPDTVKRNGALAEIARRQGTAVPTAAPLAPVAVGFAPQPLPAPTGLPAFPQPGAPVAIPQPAALTPLPNQTVDPTTVNRLVNLAQQRGLSVIDFQNYVKQNFGVADAGLLSPQNVTQLEAVLTAQPA